MNSKKLTAAIVCGLTAVAGSLSAQMISSNPTVVGSSVGVRAGTPYSTQFPNSQTYGSTTHYNSDYGTGNLTYQGYDYNNAGYRSPLATGYRYSSPERVRRSTSPRSVNRTQRVPSNVTTYGRTQSYNHYPAYYDTGYSYPANHYGYYTYSAPAYGY